MATQKQLDTLVKMAEERGLDPLPILADEGEGRLDNARVNHLFAVLRTKPKTAATLTVKPVATKITAVAATEGFYSLGGEFFKVTWNRARTYRYARRLVVGTGKGYWVVDTISKGKVFKLTEADRLTSTQAKQFGDLHHFCLCCGRELTVPLSIERGVGPICWEKLGW